jgi:hypothetical protein
LRPRNGDDNNVTSNYNRADGYHKRAADND